MARSYAATSLAVLGGIAAASLLVGMDRKRAPLRAKPERPDMTPRCRVVVVGAGFGGLEAASLLAQADAVDLTVIDSNNYHLFQPLLYQVATSALSAADIANAVRSIVPDTPRTRTLMGRVTGIDTANRLVLVGKDHSIPYDRLIIATGSQSSYFGHGAWATFAPGLKTLQDAIEVRRRILSAFEQAAGANDEAQQGKLLTFVLIGAGATGVELAGAIAELAHDTLSRAYSLRHAKARILLVEAGPRILAGFAADLSAVAAASLSNLGVTVRTGTRVSDIREGAVTLGDETVEAATILWTAGIEATPVADWLDLKTEHGGRVAVDAKLRVRGLADIHVIGDAALAQDRNGRPLPGLAPVAKQQGQYVARLITQGLRGRGEPPDFVYRDYGTLAIVGRGSAVAQLGDVHVSGIPALLMWAGAHIFFLIGFRSRVLVAANWAYAYSTHRRRNRLIEGAR